MNVIFIIRCHSLSVLKIAVNEFITQINTVLSRRVGTEYHRVWLVTDVCTEATACNRAREIELKSFGDESQL